MQNETSGQFDGFPMLSIGKIPTSNTHSNTFKYTVKNSFEMAESIKNTQLSQDYVMVSLDVVSLFTNIPKKLVLETISTNCNEWSEQVKVPKELLVEMVEFCFESSYFRFDNKFYKLLDGSSMGNPSSPVMANIVMNHILTEVERNLQFKLEILKIYVDDTLIAVPKNKTQELLETFSNYIIKSNSQWNAKLT